MGPSDGLWRLQPCGPGLLRHLLYALPRPLSEAPKIRHPVSIQNLARFRVSVDFPMFLSHAPL